MDIMIYLPDEIGERAKKEEINLSRMLRDRLIDHYERSDAMSKTLSNVEVHEVQLEDSEGGWYTGRITGTRIDNEESYPLEIYLTDDERVIEYNSDAGRYSVLQNPSVELYQEYDAGAISEGDYAAAMRAIGETPTIDL